MTLDELYNLILHTLIHCRIAAYGFGNKANTFGYQSLGSILTLCRYKTNCTVYQLYGDTVVISRFT